MTERSAWEEWLFYFLNGVARQSEDALSRAQRINLLLDTWRDRLKSPAALRLLDLLAVNPFLTVRKAEEHLRVAYNTAAIAVRQLLQEGVIYQKDDAMRDRVFCAKALLDVLEEPARLTAQPKPISREMPSAIKRKGPASSNPCRQ